MIAVNHTHLPLTTSNAATDQLERENERKSRTQMADETSQISAKAQIDPKKNPSSPPKKDKKNQYVDDINPDTAHEPVHIISIEDNPLAVDHYSTSNHEVYAHFTTHKEPIQGVVFYQACDNGSIMRWDNQTITLVIPATDADTEFLDVQISEAAQPFSFIHFSQPKPHINDLANPLNLAPEPSDPPRWGVARAMEHPEQILNRLDIVASKVTPKLSHLDDPSATKNKLDIEV